MSDEAPDVPEGVAVFPLIPPELGVNPLLLAVLHAAVFISGSDEGIIHPDAAEEALQYMADYLQRLEGEQLKKVHEDMSCLIAFANQEKWPRQWVRSLKEFFADLGLIPPPNREAQ